MTEFKFRTIGESSPNGKPKIYFTCHPDDFSESFDKICEDIFATQDLAIYYTEDMSAPINDENLLTDLACMSLVVVPVTYRLLTEDNRAMDFDIAFAKEQKMRILPIMMESGIDILYSQPDKFDKLQYLNPYSNDESEIKYADKLKKHLDSIIFPDEIADRIRAEFDAYIFLSYRKKNRSLANKLMKLIHSNPELRDIAIWYDEFLTPGENFNSNIDEMLEKSKIFALMVTPEILEKPNFVMDYEYPKAKNLCIPIVPAEMKETDKEALHSSYEDIPECINPEDTAKLKYQFMQEISTLATKKNNTPEHNYLIGLAYLEGIDVEIDREVGISLITESAEAEYPEALMYLYRYHNYESDFETALIWIKKLCELNERILPKNHPDTLESLDDLALTYSLLGEHEKAREIYEKLYTIRVKTLGEHHSETVRALYYLADVNCNVGDYKKGAELFEKRYAIQRKSLGENHPDTVTSLSILADAYGNLGEQRKSLEFAERFYVIKCKICGEEHSETLHALYTLASKYETFDENERALELYEKIYHIANKINSDYYKYSAFINLLSLCREAVDSPQVKALMERIPDLAIFLA